MILHFYLADHEPTNDNLFQDTKITNGYVIFLAKAAIAWKSPFQPLIDVEENSVRVLRLLVRVPQITTMVPQDGDPATTLRKCRSNHKAENRSNLDRSGYGWAHNLWLFVCKAHLRSWNSGMKVR